MNKLIYTTVLFFLLISCGRSGGGESYSAAPGESDYHDAKMTVAQREKSYPTEFLDVDGTFREALVGGDFVLKGTIKNRATSVTYKDIKVEINYYSKTNSLIGSETKVFYEFIKPGGVIEFKEKVWAPDGAASVGLNVIGADS